ncbi:NAD-dependent epimerase/dehydratase family protein [bacterium]|nr:NAD-dependent epimerase/dehydratase family protein [bacterium]
MILVLGSTGFLGSTVCRLLTERNREFVGVSLSTGVDLRREDHTEALFAKVRPSVVINCASFVGGIQFGLQHRSALFTNNLRMTINTYEALKRHGTPKIVNPITNCTYPGAASLFKVEEWWDGPLHDSVATYGFVKKAIWVASQAFSKEFPLVANHVILPNMYGPGDHLDAYRAHALGALVAKFVRAKRNGDPSVNVWGTGAPIREWLHIRDGAEALVRAIDVTTGEQPVNVGRAEGISVKDLAHLIRAAVDVDCEIVFDPTKPDGAPMKTIDGSTGAKALNWTPQISLADGLRETVAWYSEHLPSE